MTALALSILALAAGVYLLIKIKKEYLSGVFSVFAWFIIVASLLAIGGASVECFYQFCNRMCKGGECRMEKTMMIREGDGASCHQMEGGAACSMGGCKMEGDSVVMDKAMCEKMMGKEACDSICKMRGRCILGKSECTQMCHGMSGGGGCAMHHEEGMMDGKPGCCMGKEGEEKKACCKKKDSK